MRLLPKGNKLRKYIVLPFVLSILGHSVFFSIFKGTVPNKEITSIPKLYIIPSGQVEHEMARDIALTPLTSRLSGKNPIWANTLSLSKGLSKTHYEISEEPMPLPLDKIHTLRGLPVSIEWRALPKEKVLPRFSELFYYRLPAEVVSPQGEKTIELSDNIQLNYYIQGPISGRGIHAFNLPLEIERVPVELKLRFWVAKNGRVNQVIIEEGSGFPIIDKSMIEAIKGWRFRPIYVPSAPRYQWGIIRVRIQG